MSEDLICLIIGLVSLYLAIRITNYKNITKKRKRRNKK